MPEPGGSEGAPKTEASVPREVRERDVGQVATKLFEQRFDRAKSSTGGINGDPVAQRIYSANVLGDLSAEDIGSGYAFPDGKNEPGKPQGEAVFISVKGDTGEIGGRIVDIQARVGDTYTCRIQADDGTVRTVEGVDRHAVAQANLVAERSAIEDAFSTDAEKEVVSSYFDTIDPKVKADKRKLASDDAIREVAKDHNMLSKDDVDSVIAIVASDKTDVQDKLKNYDERLVLGTDELLDLLGESAELDIARKRTEVHPKIDDFDRQFQEARAKAEAGDDDAKAEAPKLATQRDEAQAQWLLLSKTGQSLREYRKAQAGDSSTPDADATGSFDVDAPERKGDAAGQVIAEQINRLATAIRNTPEDQHGSKDYLEQRHMLANLRMAQEAKGPYGAIIQQQVLEQVRDKSSTPQIGVERVLRSDEFKAQVTQAQKELGEFYDAKGFSAEDKKMMSEAMADPQKFESLMENDKFARASQEMMRGFFGTDLEDTQIDTIMQNLTDANNDLLDTRFRHKLKEFFTTNKTRKLTILGIILASLPVAVAAITATAAITTAAGAAGGGRR